MKNRTKKSAGFSLVEIMVAMVIGLLGMLVMLQVYSNSETQKRTTSGGDEAQNAGAIALYGLQRDIQQSGWGISAVNLLGCNVQLRAGVTLNAIAPVTINHASITGKDANTDTLLVVYGNSNGGQEGDMVTASPPPPPAPAGSYAVASIYEFNANDRVIAEPQTRPTPCNLVLDTVTAVVPTPDVTVANWLAGMTNGTLYNLGPTPKALAYAIRNGNLTVCKYLDIDPATGVDSGKNCGDATLNNDATVWVPIADNIVSMKAQYGFDTNANPMDGIVDTYSATQPTTPTAACEWVKTSAVRIALVARNSQSKQTAATPVAPVWAGTLTAAASAPLPANVAAPIILSADPNWSSYRYKVFQTIVPIRNIILKGVQAGC